MTNATAKLRQREATRYAVVMTHPDGAKTVLGFTARKSLPGLIGIVQNRGDELLALPGFDDYADPCTVAGIIFRSGHAVRFSGDTERETFYACRRAAAGA